LQIFLLMDSLGDADGRLTPYLRKYVVTKRKGRKCTKETGLLSSAYR
jgi:hypothetical protein